MRRLLDRLPWRPGRSTEGERSGSDPGPAAPPRGWTLAPGDPRLRTHLTRAAKFFGLGAVSFTTNVGLTILLTEKMRMAPEAALAISMVVVFTMNFLANRYFVFDARSQEFHHQLVLFAIASGCFRAAEYLSFVICHRLLGIQYIAALVGILIVSMMVKFVVYQRVVFHGRAMTGRRNGAAPDDGTRPVAVGLGVVALAVALRLAYVAVAGRGIRISPLDDTITYDQVARLMLAGKWWTAPLAFREPLYPALMALAYALPGPEILMLQIVQALLGGATVWIVLQGLRPFVRWPVAVLTVLLVAVNPHRVSISAMPLRETLIGFLLAAVLMLTLRAATTAAKGGLVLLALALALLIHTDVRFGPLSLMVPVMMWIVNGSARTSWRRSAAVFVLLILFMVPYQVRNQVVFGRPVLVTERVLDEWMPMAEARLGHGQPATSVAPAPPSRREWLDAWVARKRTELGTMTPDERDLFERGGQPAMTPLGIYWFQFREYWAFAVWRGEYRPYLDGRYAKPWSHAHILASSLVMVPFLVLLPFAWVGVRRSERRVMLALLGFLAVHAAIHVVIWARDRYRYPVEVIVAYVTALGAVNLWYLLRGRGRPATGTLPAGTDRPA
jgi:putative flippase GtrA